MKRLGYYAYIVVKYLTEYRLFKMLISKINLLKLIDYIFGVLTRYLVFKFSKVNNNQILFTTFQGDFTCNPKYITQELLKDAQNYQIIWGLNKTAIDKGAAKEIDSAIKVVSKYSFEFYRALYTSKLWIINSGACFGRPFLKKKEQIILQTWHGSMGIKRLNPESYQGKDKRFWVNMTTKSANATQYMLSNSTYENEIFRDSFWSESKMLKYGHPRNDLLINPGREYREKIRRKILDLYDLSDDVKILLYAPTFRDVHTFDCYHLPDKELTIALKNKFGGHWVILKRMHSSMRKYGLKFNYRKNDLICVDATAYPDLQELMTIVDIAVTDYSSWIYDFILTKKPGFIYAVDIEEYRDGRGFYYPIEETPFPIAANGEELLTNILNFDDKLYQEKLEKFLVARGNAENGCASKQTVQKIHEIMNA